MKTFCPNLSDPVIAEQFDGIARRLNNTDLAYELWDKHKGDVNLIWEEISEREFESYHNLHPDPVIQADIEKYGWDVINDLNNTYVWNLQEKYGLVETDPKKAWKTLADGSRTRVKKAFTHAEATKRMLQVRNSSPQANAVLKPVDVVRTPYKRLNRFQVVVMYDIGMPKNPDYVREDSNHVVVEEDRVHIESVVDEIGVDGTSTFNLLNHLRNNYDYILKDRPDLQNVFDLVYANRNKMRGAKVFAGPTDESGYMVHKLGNIGINTNQVLRRPNMEYFIESVLHEMVHLMSDRALNDPQTKAEQALATQVEELYWYVANGDPDVMTHYGMKNPMEFLAEMMVDREFAKEMSKFIIRRENQDNRSVLQRVIDAVLEFLGLTQRKDYTSKEKTNIHEAVRNSFEIYLKGRPKFRVMPETSFAGRDMRAYFSAAHARIQKDAFKAEPGNPESIKKAILSIGKQFDQGQLDAEHVYYHIPTATVFESTTEYLSKFGYGIPKTVKPDLREKLDRGANVGTTVHVTLEGNVNDIVADISSETGFTTNENARKELGKIIEELKREAKSVVALSEVIIADPDTKRAGTIDLVLIDDKGRIRLYDFKTSEKGFKYYNSEYKKGDITRQEKYRMQLSFYKHMLEKMLKIEVYDSNVVMLKPTVKRGVEDFDYQYTTEELSDLVLENDFLVKDRGTFSLPKADFPTLSKGEVFEVWSGDILNTGVKYNLEIVKVKESKENTSFVEVEYAFKPDVITSVILDKSYSPTEKDTRVLAPAGIDRFYQYPKGDKKNDNKLSFEGIYGEKPIKFSKKKLGETQGAVESSVWEEQMRAHKLEQGDISEVERLADKAKTALARRLEIVEKRYSFAMRKDFADFVEEVEETDTATETILRIIQYAAGVTNSLIEELEASREEGFTVEKLNRWTDYLIAYDVLDQVQALVKKDPTIFQDPDVLETLDKVVKNKNILKDLYKSEGIPLIAEWLTPYYNEIRRSFKDNRGREYRRIYRREKKKGRTKEDIEKEFGTEEEFVEAKYAEKEEDLDRQTYLYLAGELATASRDIGIMARWFDNMQDTPDAVAAAMVEAFMEVDDKIKTSSLIARTEVLDRLRELEKYRKKGNFDSEIGFYKFMLEFNENGEPTQYLLAPWKSSLYEEEAKQRKELYQKYDKKVATKRLSEWRKAHLTLDEDAFNDAYNEHLISLLKEDKISQKDYDELWNASLTTRISAEDLFKNGKISEDASDFARNWFGANRWKYSDIYGDYVNPQWKQWMVELGIDPNLKQWEQMEAVEKSDHPEARFYTFIKGMAKRANNVLPYAYQLGDRLPGVAKISSERIREGQNPITYFKETMQADMYVRPEDTERGVKELTDEHGNPKYFLPIHYTGKIEPQNQSYDIAGAYYRFWQSANEYVHKKEILAKMEMAKKFVDERSAVKRDSLGNIVKRAARTTGVADGREDPALISKTNLASQFNDWFQMAVYGKMDSDKTLVTLFGKELDLSKMIKALTSYTSLNLLGWNVVQSVANVTLGETLTAIDAFAAEHVNAASITYATGYYARNLPKMMGDVGARNNTSTASLLVERFDIMHEDVRHDTIFNKKSRVGQFLDSETLFWWQRAGEHWMQSRFLFAMMYDKKAVDKDGKDLGPMLKQYYAKDGKLFINEEVDLKKSKWTERDQQVFKRKVKGLLSRMHGEYSNEGRVAAQRYAWGQIVYQFRKFIIPGMRRRWGNKRYNQRLDQFIEGNYRTTLSFMHSLIKDINKFNTTLMAEKWVELTPHEKANIRRTAGELAMIAALTILISALWGGDDDEDDGFDDTLGEWGKEGGFAFIDNEWLNGFLEYQAERLKTEMLFFSSPGEAMKILRSPAATMSVLENTGRFFNNLVNFNEYYERGPWKGQRKITKNIVNYTPVFRQYYRFRDVKEQIVWLR